MALRTDGATVLQEFEKTFSAQVPEGVQVQIDHISGLDDPTKQLVAVLQVSGSIAEVKDSGSVAGVKDSGSNISTAASKIAGMIDSSSQDPEPTGQATADEAGNHFVLPRVFFDARETEPFPEEPGRTLPVDMHYPTQEKEQITYTLPSGYAPDGKPEDTTLKWEENAAYQLRSKVEPNSITSGRLLARGFTVLDAADYSKLRDFYQKVVQADRQQIALTGAQAGN